MTETAESTKLFRPYLGNHVPKSKTDLDLVTPVFFCTTNILYLMDVEMPPRPIGLYV